MIWTIISHLGAATIGVVIGVILMGLLVASAHR